MAATAFRAVDLAQHRSPAGITERHRQTADDR